MKKICVIGSIFFVLKTTLKINSIKKKKQTTTTKKLSGWPMSTFCHPLVYGMPVSLGHWSRLKNKIIEEEKVKELRS